jgi:hypothetical protein
MRLPVLHLSADDIREDETMVTREHPIVRKRRLDEHALRLPSAQP